MRPARQASTSRKVLVVEDNDDVREAFITLLLMHGYQASGASSGMNALEQLREGLRPCVVILDLRMPEMDGWSVWARSQTVATRECSGGTRNRHKRKSRALCELQVVQRGRVRAGSSCTWC